MGPLAGIKVIEMAGLGPVPLCGMMMSDMGAEVYLIERNSPASTESTLHVSKRDMMKRGKKPISLDLKDPAAIELLLGMIEKVDVLVEGFRPGVMERLGLGPDICLRHNPALVYGRLTGWGQEGPLSQVAGHDPNYISLTGVLYHSGDPDSPPQAPPTLLGDCAGGAAMMAWGISSALIPALREGRGQVVDAAIVDGISYLATFARSFYQAGHISGQRGGDWMDGAAPWNRSYRSADGGYITLCSVEARFYQVLLDKLELAQHPLFSDANQWDKARWPAQIKHLQSLFASQPREYWCDLLEGTDACFAPVLSYGEVQQHPHNRERAAYVEVDGQWHPAPAPRFSATVPEPAWEDVSPQSTTETLGNLGLSADLLRAAGYPISEVQTQLPVISGKSAVEECQ
jgi:crotonobetainyl-CoA:carnitine CoA-transferase CaiB-like acyl-CoA transferase